MSWLGVAISERGTIIMTTMMPPICISCTHRHDNWRTCDAFLAGIPAEIMIGYYDHRKPYPGDGGVLFDLKPREGSRVSLEFFDDLKEGLA